MPIQSFQTHEVCAAGVGDICYMGSAWKWKIMKISYLEKQTVLYNLQKAKVRIISLVLMHLEIYEMHKFMQSDKNFIIRQAAPNNLQIYGKRLFVLIAIQKNLSLNETRAQSGS